MKLDRKILTLAAVGAVALLVLRNQAAKAAKAINPVNRENIFYRGVNALGDVVDDGGSNDSFSLGAWLYEVTHDDEH